MASKKVARRSGEQKRAARINVSEGAALRIIQDAVTDAHNGEPRDYLIRDAMTRFRRASKQKRVQS